MQESFFLSYETFIVSTHATWGFLAYHNFCRLTLRQLQGFNLMLTLTSEHSSITGWAFTEATMLDPVLLKPLSISNICWFPASGRCLLDAELLFLMTFPEMGPDWQDLRMPLLPSLPDSTISQTYLPHSYNPEGTFTGLCSCSLTACFRWQWLQQNHHTLIPNSCFLTHTLFLSLPFPSSLSLLGKFQPCKAQH